ncbi:MAG TPA: hypothetical protein PKN37_06220, partial [Mesotoga sp.]|nr:hypothetical protein [Mesotoga sp.]
RRSPIVSEDRFRRVAPKFFVPELGALFLVQKKSERDVVRWPSKSEDLSFERAAARLRKKPLVAGRPAFRCTL